MKYFFISFSQILFKNVQFEYVFTSKILIEKIERP